MQFEFSWLRIRFICGLYFSLYRIFLLSKKCIYLVSVKSCILKAHHKPHICHKNYIIGLKFKFK